MSRAELLALAERVEAGDDDREFVERVAVAIGWTERKVTGLGLNGRTAGRLLWFPPYPYPWQTKGKPRPPRLTGPRHKAKTADALRALAQGTPDDK